MKKVNDTSTGKGKSQKNPLKFQSIVFRICQRILSTSLTFDPELQAVVSTTLSVTSKSPQFFDK